MKSYNRKLEGEHEFFVDLVKTFSDNQITKEILSDIIKSHRALFPLSKRTDAGIRAMFYDTKNKTNKVGIYSSEKTSTPTLNGNVELSPVRADKLDNLLIDLFDYVNEIRDENNRLKKENNLLLSIKKLAYEFVKE